MIDWIKFYDRWWNQIIKVIYYESWDLSKKITYYQKIFNNAIWQKDTDWRELSKVLKLSVWFGKYSWEVLSLSYEKEIDWKNTKKSLFFYFFSKTWSSNLIQVSFDSIWYENNKKDIDDFKTNFVVK